MAKKEKKTPAEIATTKKVNELKNIIFKPRLEAALRSTICFFKNDGFGDPEAIGSGVFIEYKGEHYVVTAAHVLAERSEKLFVILDEKDLIISGDLYNSPMPETNTRNDDKIDISVLKVDEQSRKELLKKFLPLNGNEIEQNHTPDEFKVYFSLGFPCTMTEKTPGISEIKSIAFSYQSQVIPDYNFAKKGFKKETSMAIKFDGEVTSASNPHSHLAPKMEGVSGSGLWHFFDKDKKTLIGIVIEGSTVRGQAAVIATRIDEVIRIIEENR